MRLFEVPLTALIITISTIYCVMYLPKCGLPATSLLTFNAAVNFIKTFSNVGGCNYEVPHCFVINVLFCNFKIVEVAYLSKSNNIFLPLPLKCI